MAWIETIPPASASGRLKKIYDRVASSSSQVDRILQAHALRPRSLEGHLALYKSALHSLPSELSPRDKELVGVLVSHWNGCEYCFLHHKAGLGGHLGSQADADALVRRARAALDDDDPGVLEPRDLALLTYARKLTRSPGAMTAADLGPLREAGLCDAAILELNQVVAYFAYANRTVTGLGVTIGDEQLGEHPPRTEDDELRHA